MYVPYQFKTMIAGPTIVVRHYLLSKYIGDISRNPLAPVEAGKLQPGADKENELAIGIKPLSKTPVQ